MRRRLFTAGMVAAPAVAFAQARSRKIGYVYVGSKELAASRVELIVAGARASGYALSATDVAVQLTGGDPGKIAPMTAELFAQNVSVFVAAGPAILRFARQASSTVPIVAYDFETDPVEAGFAQSIARPGGNVTGIFLDQPTFASKWIELLRECLPQLSRVALLWDPDAGRLQADTLSKIGPTLGIETDLLEVRARADYSSAFTAAKERGAGAAILLSSPLVFANVTEMGELSMRNRVPTVTMFGEFAKAGGLLAYGPKVLAANKQAGFMAGKILAGASPAALPIERPSTFEFVVNQRTADILGVTLPASILARADEVIE
jgi:putative tryptophan/tyrosine transport system substrate-binding protein